MGLPSSGKTTLGRPLAKQLAFEFIDMDDFIVKREGHTIPEIFEAKGEPYFRELEKEALRLLIGKKDVVIATGGGAPCFFDNMQVMNQSGLTLFLDVPVPSIIQRLSQGGQEGRPLLKGKELDELEDELIQKRTDRLPFYSQAAVSLAGGMISQGDVLLAVQRWLKENAS